MADVVRMLSRRQPHSVDFDALASLSNASSLDAIRTINDLSTRIGPRASRASSRHTGSIVSSSTRSRVRPRSHRHAQRTGAETTTETKGSMSRSARRKESCQNTRSIHSQEVRQHRVSMATMSSDSTKLGEIRRRRSKLEQVTRVTYPLHPYQPAIKEKSKWWSLFGRR